MSNPVNIIASRFCGRRQVWLHAGLHRLHPGRDDGLHHHHRDRQEAVRRVLEEDAGAPGPDPGAAQARRPPQEARGGRRYQNMIFCSSVFPQEVN